MAKISLLGSAKQKRKLFANFVRENVYAALILYWYPIAKNLHDKQKSNTPYSYFNWTKNSKYWQCLPQGTRSSLSYLMNILGTIIVFRNFLKLIHRRLSIFQVGSLYTSGYKNL